MRWSPSFSQATVSYQKEMRLKRQFVAWFMPHGRHEAPVVLGDNNYWRSEAPTDEEVDIAMFAILRNAQRGLAA